LLTTSFRDTKVSLKLNLPLRARSLYTQLPLKNTYGFLPITCLKLTLDSFINAVSWVNMSGWLSHLAKLNERGGKK